jgi:lysophospholipase L1-like esterase
MGMKKYISPLLFIVILFSFKKREITWVAIGDSITYLNEHSNETGNRVSKGYLTRVTEKLTNIHYVNQGHNGWTAARIADGIDKLNLVYADVYSVFLGTNDWWQGRPVGTFSDYSNNSGSKTLYGSFRIIIDKLRMLNKDARIILITPMQRGDFVYINNAKNNAWGSYREKNGQTLEQFANAVDSIGEMEHLKVIDLYHNSGITQQNMVKYKRLKDPQTGIYKNYPYPGFSNIPFDPATDEYPYPPGSINMTYDGLHPSDKGNAIIAKMIVKAMRKLKM